LLTPPLLSLLATLKGLSSSSSVPAPERDRLAARLEHVEAAVERGDLVDARLGLSLYQEDAHTFMADRRLSQIQATKLLAGVALIRREIESERGR